jgi:hypothetical protein
MSDPKQHHEEHDDLDLDAETVSDLEPDGADVRGGRAIYTILCSLTCEMPFGNCGDKTKLG